MEDVLQDKIDKEIFSALKYGIGTPISNSITGNLIDGFCVFVGFPLKVDI